MSKIIIALTILSVINLSLATTCKDGSTCPGTTTCCLSPTGSVGCCPYVNASCCSDGLHCCPNGYQCDLARGQCVRSSGNDFLAFLEEAPAKLTETTPSHKVDGPAISRILKCLNDLKLVVSDIIEIAAAAKNGDIAKLSEIFFRLIKDGQTATADCKALFQ